MKTPKIGDLITNYKRGICDRVVQVGSGRKSSAVYIAFQDGHPFTLDECVVTSGYDALLKPADLSDLIVVARAISDHAEVDEIELLEALSAEQKRQLWKALDLDTRKQLSRLSSQRQGRAAA